MFVGHAMLAFALAALAAEWRGWPTRRALAVGVAAGAFAALPDIDVAYALFAVDGSAVVAAADADAFWSAANRVHRSMTHSLVVAAVVAPAVALATLRAGEAGRTRLARSVGVALLIGLVGVALAVSGALGGFVMGAFVVAGVVLAAAVRQYADLSPRALAAAAVIGLATHPWGDLFTGEPPELLYPFGLAVFDGRVALHADPTLHLLGAFAVELATIWLAVLVVVRLTDGSVGPVFDRSVTLGAAYSVAPLLLVPPTLDVSYHFVFSILAVGLACGAVAWARSLLASDGDGNFRRLSTGRSHLLRASLSYAVIALSGVTIALFGYTAVYITL
ncbi:metal-dependent hydrolase [Halobellus rubicundus]|uniref:Metal-dependent hydrolase n=1 Tax=Halobellus rubicundus TaxID=2996466 RepID=A0ABD5MFS3_9EURY